MARVPDYSQRQVRTTPVGAPGFSMRAPDASGLSQGLQQLEAGVIRRVEEEREKADTAAVLDADRRLTEWQNQALFDPENGVYSRKGGNALDVTNQTIQNFDRIQAQIGESLKSEQQRLRYQTIVERRREALSGDLNRYEFRERQTYYDQVDQGQLETSLQSAALNYNDPEKIAYYQNKGAAVLQARANRLGMDEETARLELGKFQSDLVTAAIQMMPASEQLNVLSNEGMADLLEPSKRQALQRAAIERQESELRMQLAREERAYRERERYERALLEEATKEGDNRLARGELTEEWIESNRDRLGPQEYRYFYRQLREGANLQTDPQRYASLRIRVSQGEDVRDEARELVRNGAMSLTDYDKLITASERNSPASSVPNAYKRGNEYIRNALRVSDINPDPAAAQRLASALDDWNQWVADNPQATDAEGREQYRRITEEYALINYEQMTLTKRMPRFANATRSSIDLNHLEQASAETVRAFRAGEISQQEFEDQALLIREWDEALRKRQGVQQ